MTVRLFGLSFVAAAALATGAMAQDLKGIADCSQAQVKFYMAEGLADGEIRELCETGGSLSCKHEQCTGQAVDGLLSEGFSDAEVGAMCGEPLCESGQQAQ